MKIAIPSVQDNLDAPVSAVFGRSRFFLLVDSDTGHFTAKLNPANQTSGGAGTQAAHFIVKQGARTVLARKVGPNARRVLDKAGVTICNLEGKSARQVLNWFQSNDH
jgi:predicted Fe-Mo cluster-binding NifX family protein